MINNIPLSFEIIDSNKLNASGDISCVDFKGSGGRIWSGVQVEREDNGKPIFKYAKCARIKPEEEIYHFKKGSSLNNYCDCEIVEATEGKMICPQNKIMSTYYPLLNKASCCSPCYGKNGDLKASFPDGQCRWETKKPEIKDVSCPEGQLMKSFEINNLLSRVECCAPQLNGEYIDKHTTMMENCNNMELSEEECDEKIVGDLKDKCNKYGIRNCTLDEIKKVEDKCDKYGMKYYDTVTNNYKNTDSYLKCHTNNFDKLDQQCARNNINKCNFYELRDNNIDSVSSIKSDLINIDKIEDVFENKMKAIELKINISRILLFLFISIITVVLLVILLFIYKKHSNNENND